MWSYEMKHSNPSAILNIFRIIVLETLYIQFYPDETYFSSLYKFIYHVIIFIYIF